MRFALLVAFPIAFFATSAPPALAQNAADSFFDPEEMAKARAELKHSHGEHISSLVLAERLEYHSNGGDPLTVWEGQAWLGNDKQKLWLKTEGEYENGDGRFHEAEVQALYSRAVHPFWDLQFGIRHDIRPEPSESYAVLGAQGLAPYWFELDGQLFLSDDGDFSSRLEAEYEFRITQRLFLQPRVELNAALSDNDETGAGFGLTSAEAGLRLRYELTRGFAPYIGVSWNKFYGETRTYIRNQGEDIDQLSVVAGVRFWF